LRDSEWSAWSDREIARQCGVNDKTVGNIRRELTAENPQSGHRTYTTRHGTAATMNVSNIGSGTEKQSGGQPSANETSSGGAHADTRPHVTNNSGNNEWYTPVEVIELARSALGGIDLDPASSETANFNVQALQYLTKDDDGLSQPWQGRVWLNPPYEHPLVADFCEAACRAYRAGRIDAACILTNNATETRWLQSLFSEASAVCFVRGRIKYLNAAGEPDNTPLQGQCITYLGMQPNTFIEAFSALGECWSRG
jgi:hypothetical protein